MIAVEFRADPLPYAEYQKWQIQLRKHRREILLFCEHPPTITGGIQWKDSNLREPPEALERSGIPLVPVKRGGDLTAHEPGQLVIYPHIDLKARGLSLSRFFHALLEISARAVEDCTGVQLTINEEYPGLYLGSRKIAAIGVEAGAFFTSSGIAINVNNDLSTFQRIIACGLHQFEPGNLKDRLGEEIHLQSLANAWARMFQGFLQELSSASDPVR